MWLNFVKKMVNTKLLIPFYIPFLKFNIILNNILINTEFNSVKLFFEDKTVHVVNQILLNKYSFGHRWELINIDYYDFFKKRTKNTIIEEALYIHVYENRTLIKFDWMAKNIFIKISSFKHILISVDDVTFRLSQFSQIILNYKYNVVLFSFYKDQLNVFTTNPFNNNPIERFLFDEVLPFDLYNRFFALNAVNVNGGNLPILGNIEPPRIVLLTRTNSRLIQLGGTDGYIFNLFPKYFNSSVSFTSKNVTKIMNNKTDMPLYINMTQTPHVIYDYIPTYVTTNTLV